MCVCMYVCDVQVCVWMCGGREGRGHMLSFTFRIQSQWPLITDHCVIILRQQDQLPALGLECYASTISA